MGLAIQQLQHSKILVFLSLAFIAAAAGFNGFGVTATKMTSGAQRTVVEQSRVILIWIFFLVYQGTGHETFSIFKLAGFLLIVLGVLFFNKILDLDGYRVRYLPGEPEPEYNRLSTSDDENVNSQQQPSSSNRKTNGTTRNNTILV